MNRVALETFDFGDANEMVIRTYAANPESFHD